MIKRLHEGCLIGLGALEMLKTLASYDETIKAAMPGLDHSLERVNEIIAEYMMVGRLDDS